MLRRLDWRMLLPDPAPSRVSCSTGGPLAEGLALVLPRSLAPALPSAACDLAVAADPSAPALRAARQALRPGGSLYTEWRSLFAGGHRAIRRRLAAAGFAGIDCYTPWPSPSCIWYWLPLGNASGALQYFWAMRRPGARVGRRLRHCVRRAAWTGGMHAGLIRPICAIAQKPNTDEPSPPVPEDPVRPDRLLVAFVRQGWAGWGLGETPQRLSCLMLTGGERSISKCVAVFFAEPDPRPRLVVKFPRVLEAAEGLANEAAVLEALRARASVSLAGVPRLLFQERRGGSLVIGETALQGRLLQDQLREEDAGRLALRVTDWLVDLADRAPAAPATDWRWRIAAPAFARFAADYAGVLDGASLRRVGARLDGLGSLPSVPEQRDCSPWNVLIAPDGAVAVVDWELAEPDGVPALDLIYFLAYLAFSVDGVPFEAASDEVRASYRRALDPSTRTGAIRAACLDRYAAGLNLSPLVLNALAPLAWAIHARSEHRRLVADSGGRPGADDLCRGVFLALWDEEVRRAA